MATIKHPITGVSLNTITEKRARLEEEHAVTAWIMKLQGEAYTDIVHKLGTNANRVGEVFKGHVHSHARDLAIKMLQERGTLLN